MTAPKDYCKGEFRLDGRLRISLPIEGFTDTFEFEVEVTPAWAYGEVRIMGDIADLKTALLDELRQRIETALISSVGEAVKVSAANAKSHEKVLAEAEAAPHTVSNNRLKAFHNNIEVNRKITEGCEALLKALQEFPSDEASKK